MCCPHLTTNTRTPFVYSSYTSWNFKKGIIAPFRMIIYRKYSNILIKTKNMITNRNGMNESKKKTRFIYRKAQNYIQWWPAITAENGEEKVE